MGPSSDPVVPGVQQVRRGTLNHHLFTLGWVRRTPRGTPLPLFPPRTHRRPGNTSRYANPRHRLSSSAPGPHQTDAEALRAVRLLVRYVWIHVLPTGIIAARATSGSRSTRRYHRRCRKLARQYSRSLRVRRSDVVLRRPPWASRRSRVSCHAHQRPSCRATSSRSCWASSHRTRCHLAQQPGPDIRSSCATSVRRPVGAATSSLIQQNLPFAAVLRRLPATLELTSPRCYRHVAARGRRARLCAELVLRRWRGWARFRL